MTPPPTNRNPPDALTRVPMIGPTTAAHLASLGVASPEDLAAADPVALGAKLAEIPEAQDLSAKIELIQGYARAQTRGEPIVLASDPLLLDPPGPVWFFDLEFDSEHGEVFLAGWKPWDGDVQQIIARTEKERKRVLVDFLEACEAEGPLLVTYGSKNADEVMMRRAADRHGVPRKRVDALRYLDVQDRVVCTGSPETQILYLPVRGFHLDKVARALGRAPKPAGNISNGYHLVQLYRTFKRTGSAGIRERLLEYNAEDLYLLQAVFEGIRSLFRDVDATSGG